MMVRVVAATVLVPVAIVMGGCAAPTPESCQTNYTKTGAVVGALGGAALGAGIAALANASGGGIGLAAVGGALVGAMVGAIAGQQQDKACREMALKMALDQAVALNASRPPPAPARGETASASATASSPAAAPAPAYQSVAWANKMTNNSGTITPLGMAADAPADQVCMTYADQQTVNGQVQTVTGKACRQPDGEWKPVT
jgi:surface antigen